MTQELASYGYLVAAICFIMALRGLSSPDTSRGGNRYGIVGMAVAIGVTVATPGEIVVHGVFSGRMRVSRPEPATDGRWRHRA